MTNSNDLGGGGRGRLLVLFARRRLVELAGALWYKSSFGYESISIPYLPLNRRQMSLGYQLSRQEPTAEKELLRLLVLGGLGQLQNKNWNH